MSSGGAPGGGSAPGATVSPPDAPQPRSPPPAGDAAVFSYGRVQSRRERGLAPAAAVLYPVTVLWITLQRMARNWRLLGALLAGLVLVAGLAAAVPIYTAAGLQRSFIEHWHLQDDFRPPFAVIMAHRNSRRREPVTHEHLARLQRYLDGELRGRIGHRALATSFYGSFGSDFVLLNEAADPTGRATRAELSFMSNLVDYSEIRLGRWYAPREDGVVEVVADEKTLDDLELVVGGRYVWAYQLLPDEELTGRRVEQYRQQRFALTPIEVVGMFRPELSIDEDGDGTPDKSAVTTREWIYPPLPGRLFIPPEVFRSLQDAGLRTSTYDLQWVFDDRLIRVDQLGGLIADLRAIEERAAGMVTPCAPQLAESKWNGSPQCYTEYWLAPLEFFQRFKTILDQVALFLFSLAAPTIGMIIVYVMLIAALAVERRASEISVLHSRGAGRTQVLASFTLEWLLLAAVAALIGPHLGIVIGRLVASAQGFLQFSAGAENEAARLPLVVTEQSQRFALLATLVAVAAAVAPVVANSRFSIVTLRQVQARGLRRSFWHRYFLDLVLLGIAFYGYSALRWQQVRLASQATVDADPILFLVPVAFFIGGGLLMLRLYPLAMAGLGWLSNRFRGIVLQLTFRRLSRSGGQYVSLLVLLILTVAMGIYNGSAARTLLVNFEDRIRYQHGADLVVREAWTPPEEQQAGQGGGAPQPTSPDQPRPTAETEPPFFKRLEIEGVVAAARVLMRRAEARNAALHAGSVTMMAIVPHEFAPVAWSREDLFDPHFYDYLIQLGKHREGALVSSELKRRGKLEPGDRLTINYNNQPIDAYVVGTVPYWPSLNPERRPFVILNLDHVQDFTALEPYDSWYDVSSPEFVAHIVERLPSIGVWPQGWLDTEQILRELHREPYRRGFFGILTIGFLAAAVVAVLAFVVYTIYATRQRLIQFGALRANGLSLLQTLGVVGLEQILTVGIGLVIGIAAGNVATSLFLPFLRDRASEVQPVPPFLIVTDLTDLTRLVVIVGAAFVIGVVALALFLLRARLASALRLGEDA